MKRILAVFLAALLLLSLAGCKAEPEDLVFYVLKKEEVPSVESALLSAAKERGRAAFTGADLEGWLWSAQRVRLKNVNVKNTAADGSALFQTASTDVFVLVLGNKVLYSGGFQESGAGVYLRDAGERDFQLLFSDPFGDQADPRGNTALYDFLVDQQLLVSELKG